MKRKVFSHKFLETVHDDAKKYADKLHVTMDDYCNSSLQDANNKYANESPAVMENNVIKFRCLLDDNQSKDLAIEDLKKQLAKSQELEKSWKQAYEEKSKKSFGDI